MQKKSKPIRFEPGEEVRVTVLDLVRVEANIAENGGLIWEYKKIPIVSLVPARISSLRAIAKFYDVQEHSDEEFSVIINGLHGRWEVHLDGTDGLAFIVGCAHRGHLKFLAEMLEILGAEEYDENNHWSDVPTDEIDKDIWRHDLIVKSRGWHKEFGKTGEQIEQYLESLAKEPYSGGDLDLQQEILANLWYIDHNTDNQRTKNVVEQLRNTVDIFDSTE